MFKLVLSGSLSLLLAFSAHAKCPNCDDAPPAASKLAEVATPKTEAPKCEGHSGKHKHQAGQGKSKCEKKECTSCAENKPANSEPSSKKG